MRRDEPFWLVAARAVSAGSTRRRPRGDRDMKPANNEQRPGRAPVFVVLALLGLSAFMYASIMYKIIKFGP
jgi:hypothetical protein